MKRESAPRLEVAWHVTAFIDILGQKERLREIRAFPATEAEGAALEGLLRDTAFAVMALRKTVTSFFKAYLDASSEWSLTESVLPGALSDPVPLHVAHFSDSVALSLPVVASHDHLAPMRGIIGMLIGVSAAWCVALSEGWPVRGGIELGLSTQLDTGETYGASLERAVSLEARYADWPRIVVGQEVLRYVSFVVDAAQRGPRYKLAAATADLCRKMLLPDPVHTCHQLDTLGSQMHSFIGDQLPPRIIDAILVFAEDQVRHFRDLGDEKLAPRYEALRGYVVSRKALWA